MNIIIGKNSGFCNGVSYTISEANKCLEDGKDIYCLGEIVHNERVVQELEEKGMKVIHDINEAPDYSKVIIRAHGELKDTYDRAREKHIDLIDLTCGKIKVIKDKVCHKTMDHYVIIIGKKNHPESLGVLSFAGDYSSIVEGVEDILFCMDKVKESGLKKIFVVSQTTFNQEKFDLLVDRIKELTNLEVIVDKSICNATSNRQKETDELSQRVDIMIIVGGRNSSNTKELEVISRKNVDTVYLVQDFHDLENIEISKNCVIGIMAGASTPDVVVSEIVQYLNGLDS